MHLGVARLLTGCIGAVVTVPDARKQGVGRRILTSATDFARERGHALLLLDGIPFFYHRFGYTDVLDMAYHVLRRADILALPSSSYQTRPATIEDAPAMLALFQSAFTGYPGAFERTLAFEEARLRRVVERNPPTVAVSSSGEVAGYLRTRMGGEAHFAGEVAADTWDAARALLLAHAHRFDGAENPPEYLHWQTPPDSLITYWLADHLIRVDATMATPIPEVWAVRQQTDAHPDALWMARPAALDVMAREMLTEWQTQLARSRLLTPWRMDIHVGDEVIALDYGGELLALRDAGQPAPLSTHLSPQVFTKLLFGFRPTRWALTQPDQQIPAPVQPLLDALFPPRVGWVPATDQF
jgi:hypothetical protein